MTRGALNRPGEEGQRPRLLRHDPDLTAVLTRIALHEETVRVLQARADQAVTEDEAALFQRRADEHRDRASLSGTCSSLDWNRLSSNAPE